MREKAPRACKICPALPLFAFASPLSKFRAIFKQLAALLRLSAHAMRCEVRHESRVKSQTFVPLVYFDKSKNKKERGETTAALIKKSKRRNQ